MLPICRGNRLYSVEFRVLILRIYRSIHCKLNMYTLQNDAFYTSSGKLEFVVNGTSFFYLSLNYRFVFVPNKVYLFYFDFCCVLLCTLGFKMKHDWFRFACWLSTEREEIWPR